MHFSQNSFKFGIKYLIIECHSTIGNTVFTQCIGIPMGIDPAPFWTNLYLYYFKSEFITNLIKANKHKGLTFHGTHVSLMTYVQSMMVATLVHLS